MSMSNSEARKRAAEDSHPDSGPDTHQIKVEYVGWSQWGQYTSTAYVTEEPNADGLHPGVNKHTDEPLLLRRGPEHPWELTGLEAGAHE